MVNRIIVHLSPEERETLQHLAVHDVRTPADQVRYLVLEEAKRRGLLTKEVELQAQSVSTNQELILA